MLWFSYDHCNGIAFHDTEAEAKARAENYLQQEKDSVPDSGWSPMAVDICWGKVSQKVEMIEDRLATEEEQDMYEFETIQEYEFKDCS